jgi:hypothetical protein
MRKKNKAEQQQDARAEDGKKFLEFEQELPEQLSLFTLLDPRKESNYSNTVELYDFLPKYVWGKSNRIQERFLESIERDFECRGKKYSLTVHPARVKTKSGVQKEYYLSKKEEIVEDALRKIAIFGEAIYLDKKIGMSFSIYQLQKELKKSGHSFSRQQIVESLNILANTKIVLTCHDDDQVWTFSPIETLGFKGINEETHTFVRFSALVTKSIDENTFRLYDYQKVMSYKNVIARQLHKRISHHFTQANFAQSYDIMLTTLLRDFGLKPAASLHSNLEDVKEALEEMKSRGTIMSYSVGEPTLDAERRNKLLNVKFSISPSVQFLNEIRKGNEKKLQAKEVLAKSKS